jgi:hypothetical protein
VSDRLYLSCWLRDFNEANMLRRFAKLLEVFPFSKLARRGPILRVFAMEFAEPPAFERHFELAVTPAELIEAAREVVRPDCAVEIESAWDLWRQDGDWQVGPVPVTLLCLGPEFENETGDHLRIDFGLDVLFLPAEAPRAALRMHESNLRSLLTLVSSVEKELPLARRQLWSESGANFADLVSQAVSRFGPH